MQAEHKPYTVCLTRPLADSGKLIADLNAARIVVLSSPSIAINFLESHIVSQALIPGANALIFTSANGARAELKLDDPWTEGILQIFSIGQSTAEAVAARMSDKTNSGCATTHIEHIVADGSPEGLIRCIKAHARPASSLIHIGGQRVRKQFGQSLRALGFDYHRAVVYHSREVTEMESSVKTSFESNAVDAQLFYSRYTLQSHARRCNRLNIQWRNVTALCWSKNIANLALSLGCKNADFPIAQTHKAMTELIYQHAQNCIVE